MQTRHGAFVVHEHDATRRHWDLRIQVGGALESFALPRGPSLRTGDKRLAVHTEAHPLGYLGFEDVIPDGSYGAGAMIAWDRGRVRYLERPAEEGLLAGKLDFELWGHKLRGRFALVRTSGRGGAATEGETETWLLLKKTDAWSDERRDVVEEEPRSVLSGLTVEELPHRAVIAAELEARAVELGARPGAVEGQAVHPMLCSSPELVHPLVGAPGGPWLYELKLDGVRIVADRHDDRATLSYRTGRAATAAYPEVARALRGLLAHRVVLDGEIVAFDDEGRPSFQRLARRIHVTRASDVGRLSIEVPVVYAVFDVLALGALDLRPLPLVARKDLLRRLVPDKGLVRRLEHATADGRPLWALCEQLDLEGLVAKRASAPYHAGPRRSDDWVKIKREREADFVVVGHTFGEGARASLGALDVASWEGDRLLVRGKVGSGLRGEDVDILRERMRALERAEPAAEGRWAEPGRRRVYVEPVLVVSVRFQSWTDDGNLRAPVFRGLRSDVSPADCRVTPRPREEASTPEEPGGSVDTRVAGTRGVRLTNQTKVFWPQDGYTKGDLCGYYEAIAPFILPYLADRPVVLVRYPDGIEGKSFYQWRVPRGTPSWVRTVRVRSEERDGREVAAFVVEDVDTLLHVANLGCIPLHVLASRTRSPEECDFLTIDLDLGGGRLRDAVDLSHVSREILAEIGLHGYPKTSGQTGLHVLVPLGPGHGFDTARTLAELLGRLVQARRPDIATTERRRARRGSRVYVDTGQTGRARTIVAPWSVRAHPGATVSTPLTWDEVGHALDPTRYDLFTAPERAASVGDPMRPMLEHRPDLPAAVRALGELLAP